MNTEMLLTRMNLRAIGVRIHRLEADAELSDLGEVFRLRAPAYTTDSPNIAFVKRASVVKDLESVSVQVERYLCSARILRILQELVDEVRAIGIEPAEEVQMVSV